MNALTEAVVTVALAIVGLAMLSVIVSRKSNTTGVIQSAASGFGNSLGVAMSAVTGEDYSISLAYPNQLGGTFGFGAA
jgi:hypothetical protein